MGLIGKVLGSAGSGATALGHAIEGVAQVFKPNATRQMELSAQVQEAALGQLGAEFAQSGSTGFDRLVNGLNRLPRPFLALGTVGLFVFAMIDPAAFSQRMRGLNAVPEPLWWLLGAVVAFYFGARETHYFRESRAIGGRVILQQGGAQPPKPATDNPALADWQSGK